MNPSICAMYILKTYLYLKLFIIKLYFNRSDYVDSLCALVMSSLQKGRLLRCSMQLNIFVGHKMTGLLMIFRYFEIVILVNFSQEDITFLCLFHCKNSCLYMQSLASYILIDFLMNMIHINRLLYTDIHVYGTCMT